MTFDERIGRNVRILRESRDLSQAQLAEAIKERSEAHETSEPERPETSDDREMRLAADLADRYGVEVPDSARSSGRVHWRQQTVDKIERGVRRLTFREALLVTMALNCRLEELLHDPLHTSELISLQQALFALQDAIESAQNAAVNLGVAQRDLATRISTTRSHLDTMGDSQSRADALDLLDAAEARLAKASQMVKWRRDEDAT